MRKGLVKMEGGRHDPLPARSRGGKKWSEDEIIYLEASYGLVSDVWMSRRLGRTASAIREMASDRGLHKTSNFLTASDVARIFGVSITTSIRWIKQGLLEATRNRLVHAAKHSGGGVWQTDEESILRFIEKHPAEYELKRIDRLEFPWLYQAACEVWTAQPPRRSQWTKEQDAFLLNNNHRLSLGEMAVKLGKSRHSVACRLTRLRARKHNLPRRPRYSLQKRWSAAEEQYLAASWGKVSAEDIAMSLERPLYSVIGKVKRMRADERRKQAA